MIVEIGTCHFVTKLDALKYYRKQGILRKDVEDKIKSREIVIGRPVTPMGKKCVTIPDEGQYAIRDLRFDELEKATSYVVDDTGNGREIGADPHAIVRRGGSDDFCNRSAFALFGNKNSQIVVAVNHHLDAWMSDEEIAEHASDYMEEEFSITSSPVIARG